MTTKIATRRVSLLLLLFISCAGAASAQTTSFTYQGRLTDGGTAANANYDLQFALFDTLSGGAQIGATQPIPNVSVTAGIFTVTLDFGASAFPGANRFLEISARLAGTPSFTTLSPRQPITSTPYAVRSLNASSADAVAVSGVPGGSGNYVQNTTTQQAGANFNIGGNGKAQVSFTAPQFNTCQVGTGCTNIFRVLSTPGTFNVFVGPGTGQDLTSGGGNTFVGNATGLGTTEGIGNSFFGLGAGRVNTTGNANTIVGWVAELGSNNLTNATAIGARATVAQSDSLVLGSIAGVNGASASVNVGIGTAAPLARLDVAATGDKAALLRFSTERPWVFRQAYSGPGTALRLQPITGLKNFEITAAGGTNVATFVGDDANPRVGIGTTTPLATLDTRGTMLVSGSVGIGTTSPFLNTKLDIVGGLLRLDQLAGGGDEPLCRNSFAHTIATCSSSLRYKESVQPLRQGLHLIQRLRPVTFNWKEGGRPDLGLIAEDVAKVEPLLVTHNDKGEIEGVRYDRLNVVLINAIKQQQDEISRQQNAIDLLTTTNADLSARLRVVEGRLRPKARSARSVVRSGARREQ